MQLTWTDNSDNETGFQISRCVGLVCEDILVGANVTAYDNKVCGSPARNQAAAGTRRRKPAGMFPTASAPATRAGRRRAAACTRPVQGLCFYDFPTQARYAATARRVVYRFRPRLTASNRPLRANRLR
jgi:hypothetical protein